MNALDADAPRALTPDEIEACVSCVPRLLGACEKIEEHLLNEARTVMRLHLGEIELRPSKLPTLMAIIFKSFNFAMLQPGDTVGLQAAEAIGAPITQSILNTFHKAGSADTGNSGLQIFRELLNLSENRKMPRADIHFARDDLSFSDMYYLRRAFTAASVRDMLVDPITGVSFLTRHYGEEAPPDEFYDAFSIFAERTGRPPIPGPTERERTVTFLRLQFDIYRMFEARVTTGEIAATLEESGGVQCVYSPTALGIVDVYSLTSEEKVQHDLRKKAEKAAAAEAAKRKRRAAAAPPVADATRRARAAAAAEAAKASELEKAEAAVAALNASVIEAGVLRDHAVLFLQTSILPRLNEDTFEVASRAARVALGTLVPPGRVVPPRADLVALFKRVEIERAHSVQNILREATRIDARTWRFWIDSTKVIATGIPRSKAVRLLETVFPDARVRLTYDVFEGSDWIDVEYQSPREDDPTKALTRAINDETFAHQEALRANVGTQQQRSELLTHAQYFSLIGKYSATQTLSRLLTHPAINQRTTITNNPHEIAAVRGIEVARAAMFREFFEVIASTGSTVNPCHIQIVVDVMTSSGTLMPFTARGSIRQALGAYSESSFEAALNAFRRSAIIGVPETVSATSTAILVGALPSFGTGSIRVIASGGYEPPKYLQDAARVLVEEPTLLGDAPAIGNVRTSGRALDASPLEFDSVDEALSAKELAAIAALRRGRTFAFNRNVFPPAGQSATFGVLSNREFLAQVA